MGMSVCRGTRTGGRTKHNSLLNHLYPYSNLIVKVPQISPAGLTWCLHTLVVVRVYTHFVLLHVEGKLTQVYGTQLMVGLQVRPAPQSAVDHMREAFSMRYLQTAIQRPAQ